MEEIQPRKYHYQSLFRLVLLAKELCLMWWLISQLTDYVGVIIILVTHVDRTELDRKQLCFVPGSFL